MELKDSYFVIRDGNYIWLSQGVEPKPTDEIVELRKILVADEGYTLEKDGDIVDVVVWIKDGDSIDNYKEVKIPEEPDEPEEEDVQPE